MREISILKCRILQFIELKGITKYECYKNTGITNGVLSQPNGLSEDNLLRFLSYYKEVNPTWFLTGQGPMLLDEQPTELSPVSSTENILYKMYKEKDEEVKTLTEQLGVLKHTIQALEDKIMGLNISAGQDTPVTVTPTSGSSRKSTHSATFVNAPSKK